MDNRRFYTYAYLREDGTPYYIGKGCGSRCYSKCGRKSCYPPADKSRILILKKNLTEEEAFKHEIYMIAIFGRKNNGTGILRNLTDGGEGPSGRMMLRGHKLSPEHRQKLSLAGRGRKKTLEHRRKIGASNKGKNKLKRQFSKVWRAVFDDGTIEIITEGLPAFCEKHNLPWSKVRELSRNRCKRVENLVEVKEMDKGRWQKKGEKVRETAPHTP
jgi:hypothetical protein